MAEQNRYTERSMAVREISVSGGNYYEYGHIAAEQSGVRGLYVVVQRVVYPQEISSLRSGIVTGEVKLTEFELVKDRFQSLNMRFRHFLFGPEGEVIDTLPGTEINSVFIIPGSREGPPEFSYNRLTLGQNNTPLVRNARVEIQPHSKTGAKLPVLKYDTLSIK